jgi:two-component system LytT family response regulator
MLTSIIVDDEFKSRESLKALIERFCEDISVAAICQNGNEAMDAINTHKPDVVFMDIQLQRETGFDILKLFLRQLILNLPFAHLSFLLLTTY